MYYLRRLLIAAVLIVASWFALSALHRHLDPSTHSSEEESEDVRWIATSKYWLDRQACRWVGLCGLAHYRPDPAARSWKNKRAGQNPLRGHYGGFSAQYTDWEDPSRNQGGRKMSPDDWKGDTRVLKEVPQFVLDAAPLVHLYSGEQFWPSHIGEHLMNMSPYLNLTSLNWTEQQANLSNLHELNDGHSANNLFLHSNDDVEDRPDWLGSAGNRPVPYPDDEQDVEEYTEFSTDEEIVQPQESSEDRWSDPYAEKHRISSPFDSSFRTQPSHKRRRNQKRMPVLPRAGGYSHAPAILILVDKGNGILDAFWFYFYSYNLGTTVLNIRFGNHIGDWEHSLIRFHHGKPQAIFFSAHSGGIAYTYDAVEKGEGPGRDGRPILYSARGSHAMYATAGTHPYILPFGLLADVTDRGPLWDPALNYLGYHFNTTVTHNANARFFHETGSPDKDEMKDTIQPVLGNPGAPMGWWWYSGRWGDKFYELRDWRQWRFVGQYHYVNGPFGPRWKNLGRSKVCQSRNKCLIQKDLIGDGKRDWIGRKSR